jgi:hypothetical protein
MKPVNGTVAAIQNSDLDIKLSIAIEALKKQKQEWLCEIAEEWHNTPHGTYLMENVYYIDKILEKIKNDYK